MKRSSLRRDPEKIRAWLNQSRQNNELKRTPMRKRSDKGSREYKEFVKICSEVLPCLCECCKLRQAKTLHHKLMRSQGGKNNRDNLMPVCDLCHRWIHGNPKEATLAGWLIQKKK